MPARRTPRLRLGTRRSPLALAQAEEARARLCAAHGWREDEVVLVPVTASGDRVQDRPLAEIGGKALWTKELDAWLAEEMIDAAVHSLKDVETVRPASIAIAAVLPRADVRDVLIGAASVHGIPEGARVGTSSPRRGAQMLNRRPDVEIVMFRGNVDTRLARLAAGEAKVTLLAAAGLERLGRTGVGHRLDPHDWLPAPAQGAIGIECRSEDAATRALLAAIDDAPSHGQVMAERALLAALGGTCHTPIAALCESPAGGEGAALALRAELYSIDGAEKVDGAVTFPAGDPEAPARLAADLLARATPGIASLYSSAE